MGRGRRGRDRMVVGLL